MSVVEDKLLPSIQITVPSQIRNNNYSNNLPCLYEDNYTLENIPDTCTSCNYCTEYHIITEVAQMNMILWYIP